MLVLESSGNSAVLTERQTAVVRSETTHIKGKYRNQDFVPDAVSFDKQRGVQFVVSRWCAID